MRSNPISTLPTSRARVKNQLISAVIVHDLCAGGKSPESSLALWYPPPPYFCLKVSHLKYLGTDSSQSIDSMFLIFNVSEINDLHKRRCGGRCGYTSDANLLLLQLYAFAKTAMPTVFSMEVVDWEIFMQILDAA